MRFIVIFFLLISFLSCGRSDSSKRLNAEQLIRAELQRQQNCWNVADLNCFMDGYWKSDSLEFIGQSGVNYGWQKTLNNYQKSYPDSATMGQLEFDILSTKAIGENHFLVTGKWKLIRKADKPNGFFTLIWKRFGDEWKIIYDHSS